MTYILDLITYSVLFKLNPAALCQPSQKDVPRGTYHETEIFRTQFAYLPQRLIAAHAVGMESRSDVAFMITPTFL